MSDEADDFSLKDVPFIPDLFTIPESEADKPRLIGSKCSTCGKIDFPKRNICVHCFGDNVENALLSRKGKIYGFTIVRREKLAPHGHEVPYAFGFVDLPEKVRVLTKIDAEDLEALRTGMDCELETVKIDHENNQDVMAFKFRAGG